MTPNPPALEMAETRCRSLTQLMAPPMIAYRVPRNAVPRAQSRSSSASSATLGAKPGCDVSGIEPVGRVQGAHGQFRVLRPDQDGDLDLAGRDHLDVDPPLRQRLEHRVRHA